MSSRFVFVVPYYNCIDDIEKTIYSMVSQSFQDWRAILINDVSSDGCEKLVRQTCESLPSKLRSRFTLVENTEKHGEVRNTITSIEAIDDDEIVCRLDGGDWLTENDLLHVFNQVYGDPSVAVAWSAHRWAFTPQNISGQLTLRPGQTVYQHPWVSSHLKTFRCGDLRKVSHKNFKDADGEYIMIACDQAIFLPMMQMAHEANRKLQFVPIVGYHYNIDLGRRDLFTNERSQRQKASAEWIRERGLIR